MSAAREQQAPPPPPVVGGGYGKLRKKPIRKSHQTTPYARPPTAIRNPNNNNKSNWLSKLVDPAQRFIAYSAHRLFDSVFRKRLPAPLVGPEEVEHEARDNKHHQQVPSDPILLQGRNNSVHGNPSTSSDQGGVTDVEMILRQKTFTRSEIDRLTALLHSRTDDASMENDVKRAEVNSMKHTATFDTSEEFQKTPANGNIANYLASPFATNSQILDENNASPAEIAKAYMGSVPSKVSPSMLGIRGQALRQDSAIISSKPNVSRSPIMAVVPSPSGHVGIAENGLVTPRSRGRTAIYNMARTPYARLQSPASVKGAGPSTNVSYAPSSSQSVWEQSRLSGSRQGPLKRRSSFLDSDIGSAGPIRRIRQKSNLVPSTRLPVSGTPLSTHGTAIASERPSSSKQNALLLGESSHRPLKASVDNGGNNSGASFPPVSSKTNEMATRILEQLDKLVAPIEKSPSKLSPSMLRGPALKSLEKVDSSRVFENALGDSKKHDVASPSCDAQDTALHGKRKLAENYPTISQIPYGKLAIEANGGMTTDSNRNVILPETRIEDSGVKKSSLPPKRGFQMSAHEDYLDLDDDDDHSDAVTTTSLVEAKEEKLKSVLKEKKPITSELNMTETKPLAPSGVGNSSISVPNRKSVSFAISDAPSSSSPPAQPQSTPISDGPTSVKESNIFLGNSVNGKKDTLPKEQNSPILSLNSSFKVADVASQFTLGSSSANDSESLGTKLNAFSKPEVVRSSGFASVSTGETDSVSKVSESDKIDTQNIPKSENTVSSVVPSSAPAPGIFFGLASNNPSQNIGSSASSISSFSTSGNCRNTITNGDKVVHCNSSSHSSSAVSPAVSDTPIFKFGSSIVPPTSTAPLSEPTETKTKETSFSNLISSPLDGTSATANTSIAATAGGSNIFGVTSSAITTSTSSNLFGSTSSEIPSTATGSLFGGTASSMPSTRSTYFGGNTTTITNNTSNVFGTTSSAISNTSTSNPFSSTTPDISGKGASIFSFGASAPATQSESSAPSSSTSNSQGISNGAGFPSSTQSIPIQFGQSASSPSFGVTGSAPFSSANPFGGSSSSSTSNLFSSSSSSTAPSTMEKSVSSNSNVASNLFGSNMQAPKSPVFSSSPFTSASPSTVFAFGANSASSAASGGPTVFGSTSSSSAFPFTSSAAPATSSQPLFGNNNNSPFSLSSSPTGNNTNDGMEDSMAEDTVQGPTATATVPIFGQNPMQSPSSYVFGSTAPSGANPSSPFGMTAPSGANPSSPFGSTAPPGANPFGSTTPQASANPFGTTAPASANPFGTTAPASANPFGTTAPANGNPFGSAAPSGSNMFQFGGQQTSNPSPFQASGSLEFNTGGTSSFSLGSGAGDKSGRRKVRVSRNNKNRK
ncbi:hypothetical protein ACFE04_002168 [Oxalis oulophora]